jgi:hypothetical protein
MTSVLHATNVQVLDLLIFRQPGLAIDAKAAAIFTLLSVLKGRCKYTKTLRNGDITI